MVAALRLRDAVEVRLQLLVGEPRGAVDALQLLVALVAAPVHAGDALQLDRLQRAGVSDVGAAAEVDEVAGAVDAHLGDVGRDAVDDVDLERLCQCGEHVARLLARHHLADEGNALRRLLLHALLDALQLLLTEGLAAGKAEVVEEAVAGRRADVVLRAGEQLHHRRRHQVRGAVAQDLQGGLGGAVERQPGFGCVVDVLIRHGGALYRSSVCALTRSPRWTAHPGAGSGGPRCGAF